MCSLLLFATWSSFRFVWILLLSRAPSKRSCQTISNSARFVSQLSLHSWEKDPESAFVFCWNSNPPTQNRDGFSEIKDYMGIKILHTLQIRLSKNILILFCLFRVQGLQGNIISRYIKEYLCCFEVQITFRWRLWCSFLTYKLRSYFNTEMIETKIFPCWNYKSSSQF